MILIVKYYIMDYQDIISTTDSENDVIFNDYR